ncbi:DUF4292 domain-containing protein [Maribacter chungangensis]|uniref:DUF4292 domain-containing protein n=1 Tax=Maribacter chungangensis TaxID=1069117 RepID=A0ABW3AYD5_9FLAO
MSLKQCIRASVYMLLTVLICSCKGAKVVADSSIDERLSAKAVIRTHYQNKTDFKTLRGKLKIDYTNGDDAQSFTVSLRMEKDQGIWISAPFGIVKAYITPDRVSFYNKLENEYFDGNFSYLSQLLGTELDFYSVQNLLLGEAIFDLKKDKYLLSTTDVNYRLTPKTERELFKVLLQIEPKNFKMATQQVSQPAKGRMLQINYKNYQKVGPTVWPNQIFINAMDGTTENTITLEYRNLELNQKLNFPYTIPRGFKEIVLE